MRKPDSGRGPVIESSSLVLACCQMAVGADWTLWTAHQPPGRPGIRGRMACELNPPSYMSQVPLAAASMCVFRGRMRGRRGCRGLSYSGAERTRPTCRREEEARHGQG